VGSGIAGLSAAYYLSRRHEVHVFERDSRIGGHTHTVTVESAAGPVPIDTGFIVHNTRTYPRFCRLMAELNVETQPSDMSFAVTTPGGGFEYSSRGLSGFFAQRRNIVSLGHYQLFREIVRFNKEAPALLNQAPGGSTTTSLSLGQFLEQGRYAQVFVDRYLIPMAGAIWSMAPYVMRDFPAITLDRFMHHHGMLGLTTHPAWRVIRGGSHTYLGPLTAPFAERIHVNATITSVRRDPNSVTISFKNRPDERFDAVVFACHGDQILPLLADPAPREREILGAFRTSRNEACLHTDVSLLPRRAAARASWNYHLGDAGQVAVTYHMNRLQSLSTPEDYCVTLNANGRIDPACVILRTVYDHPLYTHEAIRAQERWIEISGQRRTHFCGAYWFYGFHEDGVRSGIRVASALGVAVE
jgi:predicted NAD/FAD-binding protein